MDTVHGSRTGSRFGKYRIGRLLGRGGMGEVYEATDTDKDRVVALKILIGNATTDPDYRRRFTREAHAAAQLQEPHVIPIHDWGEIDGCLYIDMRLVCGVNLRDLLSDGPIAPPRAVGICGQIADALDAAHAQGLIHRDIKPANIIVTAGDFAYLLDFGITEHVEDTRLTQTGIVVGSLAYVAPERLIGAEATAAVDVYGLACVLFECLTGSAPFGPDTMAKAITEQLYTPPPAPSVANPAVPRGLDQVTVTGMAKAPYGRYRSAGELVQAARFALSEPGSIASPSAPETVVASTGYPELAAARGRFEVQAPAVPPTPSNAPPIPGAVSVSRRRWLIVAAVGAALVFATASLGIGLLLGMRSGSGSVSTADTSAALTRLPIPAPVPEPMPQPSVPEPMPQPSVPSRRDSTPAVAGPTGIRGPDPLGVSCDTGFTHPSGHGYGSRALRGSPSTSCVFVYNVLRAYWSAGLPNAAPRKIAAAGSRPCGLPGDDRCYGTRFVMDCAVYGSDDWITCTGGKGARIYLY